MSASDELGTTRTRREGDVKGDQSLFASVRAASTDESALEGKKTMTLSYQVSRSFDLNWTIGAEGTYLS
jgi:hypothetical protein